MQRECSVSWCLLFLTAQHTAHVNTSTPCQQHHQQHTQLEVIDGEVWANVWQTECIARVDPRSGSVTGWVLMHGLAHALHERGLPMKGKGMDVLNGEKAEGDGMEGGRRVGRERGGRGSGGRGECNPPPPPPTRTPQRSRRQRHKRRKKRPPTPLPKYTHKHETTQQASRGTRRGGGSSSLASTGREFSR